MKEILTNNITANARQPILKATLDHLQEAYTDLFTILVETLYSSNSQGPIMFQGDIYETLVGSGTWIIEEGWIYVIPDKKFYKLEANTLSTAGGNIPVLQYASDEFIAGVDPVEFSDQNTHNVHADKKVEFVSGAVGSGVANYYDVIKFIDRFALNNLTAFNSIDNGAGDVREFSQVFPVNFDTQPSAFYFFTSSFDHDAYDNLISYSVTLRNTTTGITYKMPLQETGGVWDYETSIHRGGTDPQLLVTIKAGGFFDTADDYEIVFYAKYSV